MTRYGQTMAEALQGINEKLKPSDGAGAYVKDFRKSDAPQFKGKSDYNPLVSQPPRWWGAEMRQAPACRS